MTHTMCIMDVSLSFWIFVDFVCLCVELVMTTYLRDLTNSCPMYSLSSIGKTVQNRDIWVVEITNNTGPEMLMAGNIHGCVALSCLVSSAYFLILCFAAPITAKFNF